MKIQGFYNPTHVIRCFLENEYAFDIEYPQWTIRIAFAKGSWSMAKVKKGEVVDTIVVHDQFEGYETQDSLTEGLIESLAEQHAQRWNGKPHSRAEDSDFISKLLKFWAGKSDKIVSISVLQPGRNAHVDFATGEFILSPREEDFKA